MSLVAGMSAQDKRVKDIKGVSGLPPRPPSRRGHSSSGLTTCSEKQVVWLSHSLLPGQTLPTDLTLAQLVAILQDHGLAAGYPILELFLTIQKRKRRTGLTSMDTSHDKHSSGAFL